ncbi:hypothetical protein ACLMJK_005116 [Lecanora helva]
MTAGLDILDPFFEGSLDKYRDNRLLYLLLASSTTIGFLVISLFTFKVIRLLLSLFVLPGKSLRTFGQPSKTWALVTGASDGIGKEFALQLSRSGYSTVLVSRTASKLETLASEIKSKYNTQTRVLAMDFGAIDVGDYAKLKALVDSLDIGILINNVGASHDIPVPFTQTALQEMDKIITVNCSATLRVTQLVAAGMVQRKRGLILTMGSFGGTIPTPLLATYSGSKAFLQQWSTALGSELAPYNITVELVQSYLVTSAMSKIRKSSAMIPTPRAFVKSVLSSIGRSGGAQGYSYTSTPYWSHAILQWSVAAFIGPGNKLLLMYNRWFHEGIRKRALTKQRRKAGEKTM